MVQLFYHPLLDSTNRLAKELAWQGAAPGTVVQAAQQSAGRGQYERSFLSPLGGLYFSLILRPTLQAQEVAMVTLAAGLGCRDAISDQCQLRTRIKWPNDLYCKEKKIAGILSECCMPLDGAAHAVIVGVGLNVNSTVADFPEELRVIVTTLRECSGTSQNMAALLWECVAGICMRVNQLVVDRSAFIRDWQEADYLAGRSIQHLLRDTRLCTGIGRGIDDQGRYCIQEDKGQIRKILGGQLRLLEPAEE